MSYLIDTNVLSEARRKKPDAQVLSWLAARPATKLYLSVLTLGEIRKGFEQLTPFNAEKKAELLDWLELELPQYFQKRLLSVDARVVDVWGKMVAKAARPLPAIDSLLAATALAHQLVLVTRNVKDFVGLGVDVLDPWQVAN